MSSLAGAMRAKHQKPLAADAWYWEPVSCIEPLFREIMFESNRIHDPCCGSGRIPITAQRYGYEASGSDLVDRGYGAAGVNFFEDMT